MRSAFDTWHREQFWARSSRSESDARLKDIAAAGKAAEAELARRAAWDAMRTAALYAWQVSDIARDDWSATPATTAPA